MIEASNLSKHYGDKTAVNDITFTVKPGQVTGFLGPNGAGKSTTMRMIMGLDKPSSGQVTVNGRSYASHRAPCTQAGGLLEANAVHPGRSAYSHLRALAATHGIGKGRVDEVIELTGLGAAAKKRVGGYSLGMGQRLGIAVALLGDPDTLVLDEPVNGLDPEGVLWVRNLVRYLASQNRTVFLSSHLMSEMTQTADHLIVIGRGRILTDAPIGDVIAGSGKSFTRVAADEDQRLDELLVASGARVTRSEDGYLEIVGLEARSIAQIAMDNRILIWEITPVSASLEEAYMNLTRDDVEFGSQDLPSMVAEGASA